MKYLHQLKEASINSIKIKLLNDNETKKFISTFKDASSYKESKYDIYGASDGIVFVGGIVLNKKPDLKIYNKYKLKVDIDIAFIYLIHKYRRMGLGQKLLNIPMKKYNHISLTTNKGYTNIGAYELAKKNDFRIVEERGRTSSWYWSKK